MTELPQINSWGAVAAGLAAFVIGPAWFSPALFGKHWAESVEASGLRKGSAPLAMGMALVASVISAFAMAILFHIGRIDTISMGALGGLLVGMGIVAVSGLSDVLFVGQARLWWLVQAGYRIVGFVVMGAVVGASAPPPPAASPTAPTAAIQETVGTPAAAQDSAPKADSAR
jgi:hypothetical protein